MFRNIDTFSLLLQVDPKHTITTCHLNAKKEAKLINFYMAFGRRKALFDSQLQGRKCLLYLFFIRNDN